MKRIISILLVLSVLCSLPIFACAEQGGNFVFRNGIKWGISESEVIEREGLGNTSYFANDTELPKGAYLRSLYLDSVHFGDYWDSMLIYRLRNDILISACYVIYDEIDVEGTVKELTGVYGNEVSITPLSKAELFALVFGYDAGGLRAKELMNDPGFDAVAETMHYWKLRDGTEILLAVDSMTGKEPVSVVCYWNQAFKYTMELLNSKAIAKSLITPPPQAASDSVTVMYSDGREVSYSRDEMRSALGGNMVLLRNSSMDGIIDCDMTPVYEAMDFAILKGAVKIRTPLTPEQFEAAQSWRDLQLTDALPGVNPEAYAWDNYYKILFPTLEMFWISDNFDGTYNIQFGFIGGSNGNTHEDIAEAIAKGREEALRIVKSIPSFCNTDFNKLEFLYDYITHYVKYYDNSLWALSYYDDRVHVHLLYDALISKETVCAGYAYAFAYLCELAGLDARYVSMESYNPDNTETHAVVIAKEGDSYHWFDPTWDAGKDQIKDGFEYFGISDNRMFYNHIYARSYYPRKLYPECPNNISKRRTGYWDFDTMTYYSF